MPRWRKTVGYRAIIGDCDDTNRFYISLGFKEFEVFLTLWYEWNLYQIYVMLITLP